MRRLGIAIVVLLLVAVGGASAQPEQPHGITVQGSATAPIAPDAAVVTFGVAGRAPLVAAALALVARRAARVASAVRRTGVAARDLQTTEISVQPAFGKHGRVVGYRAVDTVQVLERRLSRLGGLFSAGAAGGATSIQGPSFMATHGDAAYGLALDAAFGKAEAKARRLAARAGVKLGRPIDIVEGEAPQPFASSLSASQVFAPPTSIAVQPGQVTVGATVTVTYAIS